MTAPYLTPLYCAQLADGPATPVVLSHALGLDHTMWLGTAAVWKGQRPVLAYDQRGQGRSPRPPGALTMAELVADAAAVIEHWARGPVIFIGLSMGGMVAQGLALQHPARLKGVVLAHTVARYAEVARQAWQQRITAVRAGGIAAVVDTVLARYLSAEVRRSQPELEATLRQLLLANDAAAYVQACAAVATVDWLDDLHRISCPTLVLGGLHDTGAPAEMMRALHERIPGSTFTLLDQASHLGPLEQPLAFQAAVQRFIAQLEGAPALSL